MRKDYFYISVRNNNTKEVIAEKRSGYSVGDIGLHKGKSWSGAEIWIATHIPTGTKLTSTESENTGANKTRNAALKEAQKRITADENFEQRIADYKKTENFKQFSKSRYNQTVTGVF